MSNEAASYEAIHCWLTVRESETERTQVKAACVRWERGLAVVVMPDGTCSVVHQSTGCFVIDNLARQKASDVLDAMVGLADWTKERPTIPKEALEKAGAILKGNKVAGWK